MPLERPRDLGDVRDVMRRPARQQLAERDAPELRMDAGERHHRCGEAPAVECREAGAAGIREQRKQPLRVLCAVCLHPRFAIERRERGSPALLDDGSNTRYPVVVFFFFFVVIASFTVARGPLPQYFLLVAP